MTRLLPALFITAILSAQTSGPAKGSLVIAGGGKLGGAILNRFIELAGGPAAPVVVIPTAGEDVKDGWLERCTLARRDDEPDRAALTRSGRG